MEKHFSQACENNKKPILEQLTKHFENSQHILEIGSGTGQHSVFFAAAFPHLVWQTSDVPENHPSILAYGVDEALENWRQPMNFMVGKDEWPGLQLSHVFDGIFSANTAHIMQASEVKLMMSLIVQHLPVGGVFCQYGPFKFRGEFTSQSNKEFDESLRMRGYGGYRDIIELEAWCKTDDGKLELKDSIAMPANNHLLVWEKR